jgi:hypothetical protein
MVAHRRGDERQAMPARTASRLIGLPVLLMLALLAASCSSGDTGTTEDPADVPTSTSTTAPETTTTEQTTTSSTPIDPDPASVPVETLLGSWQLASGYVITFGEDGRWKVADPETPDAPFDFGSFEIDEATLIVTTDPGVVEGCDVGDTGYYEISVPIDEEGLQLDPIDDPCVPRRSDFGRGFAPIP